MKRRERSTVDETVLESAQERNNRFGEFGTESSSARGDGRDCGRRVGHRAGGMQRGVRGNGAVKAAEGNREAISGVVRVGVSVDTGGQDLASVQLLLSLRKG